MRIEKIHKKFIFKFINKKIDIKIKICNLN